MPGKGAFFGQPPLTQPIPVVGEGLVPSRRKQASIPAKARQIRMRLRIRPAFLCDFRLPAGRPQGPPLRGWREIAGRRGRRPLRGRRRGLFPSQSTGGRTRRLTAPPVGGAKWANKETGRKPKGDLPIFPGSSSVIRFAGNVEGDVTYRIRTSPPPQCEHWGTSPYSGGGFAERRGRRPLRGALPDVGDEILRCAQDDSAGGRGKRL